MMKLLYVVRPAGDLLEAVRVGIAVSKRAGNAVWRNRVRRLVRESYRNNKSDLIDHCSAKSVLINLVFIPGGFKKKYHRNLFLSDIEPLVRELLKKLIDKI